MKPCAFCAIARGDAAGWVVARDRDALAFLDRAPLRPGHTLVMPREHVETLDELSAADLGALFALAQRCSRAMRDALGADGSLLVVNTRVSQSVPHAHAHVVPRREGDGLFRAGMVWIRKRYAEGEADAIAAKLREALGP